MEPGEPNNVVARLFGMDGDYARHSQARVGNFLHQAIEANITVLPI
jgi:hypothetical protein